MKYKIVTSGKTKVVTLAEISRNLKVSSEIYALSDKEIYLGPVYHKTLVFFSVEFAHYALQNYTKKNIPEAEICIHLTRKWLEDRESVSNEQLIAAANAAYAANAANAANAAYHANSAAANSAAIAAAYSSYAPAHAANAAYAAYAADAAGVYGDKEFIRQGNFILDFLKSGKNLFLV